MTEIRVTGTGLAASVPDEALFNFGCEVLAADAEAALAGANEQAGLVLGMLDQMGVPSDRRGVERANVHQRTRWSDKMQREVRVGWAAHTAVTCRLSDADTAFDLLQRAAAIEGVSIDGPNWAILPGNPVHDTARKLAVEDGRTKAKSYADAAGVQLGDLVQLIEGGASMIHGRPMMDRAMASEQSMPLEPTEQTVSATVTLVYTTVE